MPEFNNDNRGGYWSDGDVEYLRNTLHLSPDQIRSLVEQYPDGPASMGPNNPIPDNSRRGQDWTRQYYPDGGTGNGNQDPYGGGGGGGGQDPRNPIDTGGPGTGPVGGPGPVSYSPGAFNLADPTAFFDPKFIDQYFNSGRGNLARSAGGAVSSAQRTAGAQAGAGNYLNKGAFVTGAGSQARSPYAGAFGQLEQGRAGALQENQQGLFGALNNKALMEEQVRAARQGFDFTKEKDQRDYEELKRQFGLNWELQYNQMQSQRDQWKNANSANPLDLLTGLLGAGSSLAGMFGSGANPTSLLPKTQRDYATGANKVIPKTYNMRGW